MAILLVSELVSNAVLHAGTSIAVVIRNHGQRIRVEVHDGDPIEASRKHYSPLATTGRGLMLVERMSDSWGVTSSGDGKSVWFELSQTEPGRASSDAFAFDELAFAEELEGTAGSNRSAFDSGEDLGTGEPWRDPRALVRLRS